MMDRGRRGDWITTVDMGVAMETGKSPTDWLGRELGRELPAKEDYQLMFPNTKKWSIREHVCLISSQNLHLWPNVALTLEPWSVHAASFSSNGGWVLIGRIRSSRLNWLSPMSSRLMIWFWFHQAWMDPYWGQLVLNYAKGLVFIYICWVCTFVRGQDNTSVEFVRSSEARIIHLLSLYVVRGLDNTSVEFVRSSEARIIHLLSLYVRQRPG